MHDMRSLRSVCIECLHTCTFFYRMIITAMTNLILSLLQGRKYVILKIPLTILRVSDIWRGSNKIVVVEEELVRFGCETCHCLPMLELYFRYENRAKALTVCVQFKFTLLYLFSRFIASEISNRHSLLCIIWIWRDTWTPRKGASTVIVRWTMPKFFSISNKRMTSDFHALENRIYSVNLEFPFNRTFEENNMQQKELFSSPSSVDTLKCFHQKARKFETKETFSKLHKLADENRLLRWSAKLRNHSFLRR